MGAQVTVVTGPARSGKTEELLARYRQALRAKPAAPNRVLWLAPTQRSASELRDRLLTGELRACFSPGVATFDRFADAVLQHAAVEIRPISIQFKRQLLRRLVDAAHAGGRLKHFGAIAATDGMVELISAFISELKRLEIWPVEFDAACHARGMTAKDRELIRLYYDYQEALARHKLYDKEGRYWSARRLLREGQRRPYEHLELVVVDGFTDFTGTQHEILQILAERVDELVITIPLETPTLRPDLFGKSTETFQKLRARHPGLAVESLAGRAADDWPTMVHLERDLFKSPHDLQPLENVEGVEILACSRQLGEIEQVGRRVKRLILEERVPPGDVVVVFRSLRDVAPLVREVFDELGLPYALEEQPTLDTAPLVKSLLALLRLQIDDWPFRQVLALLSNNYFQPHLPGWSEGAPQAAAERLVREFQLPKGRVELLEQVDRWRQLGRDEGESDLWGASARRRIQDAKVAGPLFDWLARALDGLPRRATQTHWAKALANLAQRAGMLGVIARDESDSTAARMDRQAWERLQKDLGAGDLLAGWLDEVPPSLSLEDVLKLMQDILRWEALAREHDEVGRVRVLSAASARALRIPYLFFAGLSERAVPPADREDRLYAEGDYNRLIEAGLPLENRANRSQAEMLLFYEVITRPTRRLVLSFPALDASAQPLAPSSYLVEVERTFGEGKLARTEIADLSPIPREAQPLAPCDLRIKAVSAALEGDAKLLAGLLRADARPGLAENLVAGLRLTHARQRGDSFGPYEGVLLGAEARRRMAEDFGPDYLWSPSRLEQYAHCPYQFYLQRVLRIAPVAELALEVDYMQRGQLLHEALKTVHRRLNEQAGRPTSPATEDEAQFLQRFAKVLRELIAAPTTGDLAAAQREIDRRLLTAWGSEYHAQHANYDALWSQHDGPLRPAHFEVRFGPAHRAHQEGEDAISTDEPFVFDLGGESIHITGRIDRIDVGEISGQPVFNVLDYKSGLSGSLKISDIEAGTALQLPLYVLAAQQLILADKGAVPWRTAYWFIRDQGYSDRKSLAMHELRGGALAPLGSWELLQQTVRERVRELVTGIRQAEFPMASVDEQCTRLCDFKTVCRVNQVRALEKSWPPPPPSEPV